MKNKKGQIGAGISLGNLALSHPLLSVLILLIVFWFILTALSSLKDTVFLSGIGTGAFNILVQINYWLVLALFIGVQIGAVLVFYRVIKFISKLARDYKRYILRWELKINQLINN